MSEGKQVGKPLPDTRCSESNSVSSLEALQPTVQLKSCVPSPMVERFDGVLRIDVPYMFLICI